MTSKTAIKLILCVAALLLVAGCGKSGGTADRTAAGQSSVQSVLEQGMSAADGDTAASGSPDIPGAEPLPEPVTDTTAGSDLASNAAPGTEVSDEAVTAPVPDADAEPISVPTPGQSAPADGIDVDLTAMSSTMIYSEVYNMMYYPENYVGKTIKMEGIYAVSHDEVTNKTYHACIIMDATACCSQGVEFELTDDYTYPQDYPAEDGDVCVVGTFDTYQEDGYTYCTLRNARLAS